MHSHALRKSNNINGAAQTSFISDIGLQNLPGERHQTCHRESTSFGYE